MKKQCIINSIFELNELQKQIISQIKSSTENINSLFVNQPPIESFRKLKFHKLINDSIFNEHINFIEYLNQTFTYLVCICAGKIILSEFPNKTIIINFGVQSGYDLMSVDELIICECFSATSVRNNNKLRKDIMRLSENKSAKNKFVVFYTENLKTDLDYINHLQSQHSDINLFPLSFENLIKIEATENSKTSQ